jgi:hypothetical protein
VQMIATMAMNMPALDDEYRTTLIVVPAALLHQVSPLRTLILERVLTMISGKTSSTQRAIIFSKFVSITGKIN